MTLKRLWGHWGLSKWPCHFLYFSFCASTMNLQKNRCFKSCWFYDDGSNHEAWVAIYCWSTRPTQSHGLVGIIVFTLVVRPHFSNLEKQNNRKLLFATGVTMGLAEWIVDDTVSFIFFSKVTTNVNKSELFLKSYVKKTRVMKKPSSNADHIKYSSTDCNL